jgi:hypothetical protein
MLKKREISDLLNWKLRDIKKQDSRVQKLPLMNTRLAIKGKICQTMLFLVVYRKNLRKTLALLEPAVDLAKQ